MGRKSDETESLKINGRNTHQQASEPKEDPVGKEETCILPEIAWRDVVDWHFRR